MTDTPIVPTVELVEDVTEETVETPEENIEAESVTTEASEEVEFKTSYVIEIPAASDVTSIYFVMLGAVLVAYAILNLIIGIVRK